MSTAEKPRSRRPRDPDRGAKILASALRLFYSRGFHAVSVDEIGAAAGASGAAIYRHFSGKEEILATLFDEALDQYLLAIPDAGEDPLAELESLVRGHLEFTVAHRELASLWANEHRSLTGDHQRRINRRTRQYIDRWISVLQRAFPAHDVPELHTAALTAIGMTTALSATPGRPLGAAEQAIVRQMLMAGLRSFET
jgi:AcrR family transcriptional regulator